MATYSRLLPVLLLIALVGSWSRPGAAQDVLPPLNDTPTGLSLPGKFIGFDLASPALSEQMDFYRSVFGWSYRAQSSEDGYVLILNDGRPIGGMFGYDPPQGEQDGAVWVCLMSVTDVDGAVRVAESNGGRLELGPVDVSRRGRHALLRDPADALFGVLRSDSGDPPDAEVPIGGFIWVDLFAREPERMGRFYTALAPYQSEQRPVTENVMRTLLTAHGMPRAGIVPVDEEANRAAWVPYVRVADVAATLERVVQGGGFAIVVPDPAILDGKVAVFVDPNGAVTGIVEWSYAEEDAS
ncbi:MAG: VOC family protein [Xanthomonadales bacterium]